MKSVKIILACILIFNVIYAQQPGNNTIKLKYKNGVYYHNSLPYTGICYDFYPNGNKKTELTFENGFKHGKETQWYYSGQVEYIRFYKQNEPDSTWESYHNNGTLKDVSIYETNRLTKISYQNNYISNEINMIKVNNKWIIDSIQKSYDNHGIITISKVYKDGLIIEVINYWKDKNIPQFITFYKDSIGQIYKTKKEFYINGNIKAIAEYKSKYDNKEHGRYSEYYPDSTKKSEGSLYLGNKHRIWHEYDSTGFENIKTYEYGLEVAYNIFNMRAFKENIGKYGFKDIYDNVIIPPEYKHIEYSADYNHEVYTIKDNFSKAGLIDRKGNIIIKPRYYSIDYIAGYDFVFCRKEYNNKLKYKAFNIRKHKFVGNKCSNIYYTGDYIITQNSLRNFGELTNKYRLHVYNKNGYKMMSIKCEGNELTKKINEILRILYPNMELPQITSY